MIALWVAVAVLACVVLLLGIGYVHLSGEVRDLGKVETQAAAAVRRQVNGHTDVLALHIGQLADHGRELTRHDDILVEHDKQLTALNDERLIGGGR